ncbi:MAG: hypothetical protein CFH43_00132 [Proteobacteria bacterium]|nr:MAG: hypothetical protein CFH43_00132 [Pseudomonadota bacterium]
MKKTSLNNYMKKAAGYTIDQTILIVAVIAVLITLIIASVGWDLLNRTSGTKLASYLKQIEESNGGFYARQGVWPHIAVDDAGVIGTPNGEHNIAVLAAQDSVSGTNQYNERWKPLLSGFDISSNGEQVSHQFGSGGVISQQTGTCDDGKTHLIITMEDVPLTEITNADETIDGEIDESAGRVQYTDLVTDIQDMTYCANLLN